MTAGCRQSGEGPPTKAPAPGVTAPASPATPATFVGLAKCAGCHPKETEAYRGPTTRGPCRWPGRTPSSAISAARRSREAARRPRSSSATASTSSAPTAPTASRGEFEISHTFGVEPAPAVPRRRFPAGRLQALGIAWDARPRAEGGQRWFSLYPGDAAPRPDPLHWTGREQTWNYQCAECHSTDLRKGYDLASEQLPDDVGRADRVLRGVPRPGLGARRVGGVARHGRRRRQAERRGDRRPFWSRSGDPPGAWAIKDPARGIAEWTGAARSTAEVDACARCHARRRPIVDPYPYGRPLPRHPRARACSTPGSITPTARSSARSTSGARSCRAACSAPA